MYVLFGICVLVLKECSGSGLKVLEHVLLVRTCSSLVPVLTVLLSGMERGGGGKRRNISGNMQITIHCEANASTHDK